METAHAQGRTWPRGHASPHSASRLVSHAELSKTLHGHGVALDSDRHGSWAVVLLSRSAGVQQGAVGSLSVLMILLQRDYSD